MRRTVSHACRKCTYNSQWSQDANIMRVDRLQVVGPTTGKAPHSIIRETTNSTQDIHLACKNDCTLKGNFQQKSLFSAMLWFPNSAFKFMVLGDRSPVSFKQNDV